MSITQRSRHPFSLCQRNDNSAAATITLIYESYSTSLLCKACNDNTVTYLISRITSLFDTENKLISLDVYKRQVQK